MAQFLDELFIAKVGEPKDNFTYSFTLASRLGGILIELESLYGPRDKNFTILGIEFCGSQPKYWFPGNCGNIVIQLTPSTLNDLTQAIYQLAHEAVHMLDPGEAGSVSVFEEGIANSFAEKKTKEIQPDYASVHPKYDDATTLSNRVMAINPQVIKNFREKGTKFRAIKSVELQHACPGLAAKDADILCSHFGPWDGKII